MFIGLLVFTTVSFTACQNTKSAENQRGAMVDDVPLDRRIGTIESLGGIPTSSQGTHLLKLKDGSNILLRSLNINLDDTKYKDKTVEVRGLLTYTKANKQVMDVQNIDILEEAPVEEKAKVTTKDYKNTTMRISLKYRDDFELNEDSKSVSFTKKIVDPSTTTAKDASMGKMLSSRIHGIYIKTTAHKEGETLADFLKLKGTSSDLLPSDYSKSKIGTTGIDALKQTSVDGLTIHFYFEHANSFYEMSYIGSDDSENLTDQNHFYEMLNSLTFLNAEPASTTSSTSTKEKK